MKRIVHLDYETYCDLDITKVGAHRYAEDPSCEVLLVSWAVGDEEQFRRGEYEIKTWETGRMDSELDGVLAGLDSPVNADKAFPQELIDLFEDPDVELWAHNASFERVVTKYVVGIDVPIERWRDTAVLASYVSFPAGLGPLSSVLGLDSGDMGKLATGKALLRYFAGPQKDGTRNYPVSSREKWAQFVEYNRRDVVAQIEVWRKLSRKVDWAELWEDWARSERINDYGIPINTRMLRSAVRLVEEEQGRLSAEFVKRTGGVNPAARDQVLRYVKERGYVFDDLTAAHVVRGIDRLSEGLSSVYDPRQARAFREALWALKMRQKISLTSVKKYATLEKAVGRDDRLRGALYYYGAARTGRWAGRIFQPQNLPRPHWSLEGLMVEMASVIEHGDRAFIESCFGDVMEVMKSALRTVVQAPEGCILCDCDWSAIENRGIGWIAEEERILAGARKGLDPYIDFATEMYGQSYEEIYHEVKVLKNKKKRTNAKPAVLGAGYGLGKGTVRINPKTGEKEATGLLGYAWAMGVDLTPEESEKSVETWRAAHPNVVEYWNELVRAAKAVTSGKRRTVRARKVIMDRDSNWLRMRLPSGRSLFYYKPAVQMRETPWGEVRPTFTYVGRLPSGGWGRQATHGGKLVENIVQAIASDVLRFGLRRAEEEGLKVFMHVHDQMLLDPPKGCAAEQLEMLESIMSESPPWAPDLPLSADGFLSPVFVKD